MSFRRRLYAARTIRGGLSRARQEVPIEYIPPIVAELLRDRMFAGQVAINPFPADFDKFNNHTRLASVDSDREFLWTGAVLKGFSDEITYFVEQKELYETNFSAGKFQLASDSLDKVFGELGVSLWYLENKLQFLHLTEGLAAQKEFLEKTISNRNIDIFAGLFGYYFSIRSEDNYSYNELVAEASELLNGKGLGDYTLFHVLPYDHTEIIEPSGVVSWEESRPIVDRYLAFVSMAQLQVARHYECDLGHIRRAVGLLDKVRDKSLNGIRRVLGGPVENHKSGYSDELKRFDDYTEGRYEACLSKIEPSLELTARAAAITGTRLDGTFEEGSLAVEAVSCLSQMLMVSPGYLTARSRLQKICMICPRHSISTEIVTFLERAQDNVANDAEYSELERFAALRSPTANPWHEDALESLGIPRELFETFPSSSSLQLRKALQLPVAEAFSLLDSLQLTEDRRTLYKGHVAMRRDSYMVAAQHYKQATASSNHFTVNRARAYLYKALLANGDIEEALDVVIDHCLDNPSSYRLYPLEKLIDQIKGNPLISASISFAILLHLAARNISSKWEGDISDAYENIMAAMSSSRPSQSINLASGVDKPRLVYFLRYICVPRVFDDTIDFSSVSEIDEERIAVCQRLIALDPNNSSEYATEIKTITRETNIYQALKKVESSKIFVDEAGIRAAVNSTLKDAFERFQKLSRSPGLTYQAEKISKLLEGLIKDNSSFDLKNLRLPASERESLFVNMLAEFTTQFALNPAYGLDTHLSTTIRHGSFEGHIRSPLAAQDLLCAVSGSENNYLMPRRWELAFEMASTGQREEILRALSRFTGRVQDQLESYLRELLHVRGVDTNTKGLFNFMVSNDEQSELMKTLGDNTQYAEFVDRLFAFSWSSVERSLENVRNELQKSMLPAMDSAVTSLLHSTSHLSAIEGYSEFRDAAINARTNLQSAIETVSNWFQRPLDFGRDPFDFEIALDVARKQIANCYIQTSIYSKIAVNVKSKVAGRFLDGLVEILFILLQNIIRHGGNEHNPSGVDFSATQKDNGVLIVLSNEVADSVPIVGLQAIAVEAASRYQRDTAMRFARQEGGSGLSKVWRIIEYDFSVEHNLSLQVSEVERRFTVMLWIADITAPTKEA